MHRAFFILALILSIYFYVFADSRGISRRKEQINTRGLFIIQYAKTPFVGWFFSSLIENLEHLSDSSLYINFFSFTMGLIFWQVKIEISAERKKCS